MSPVVSMLLTIVVCYLIGSIPFSLLIAKFAGGVDLQKIGSGNVGATNVARSLGAKWGILALVADATKGLVSVGLVPLVIVVAAEYSMHQLVLAAVFAVLGHMFSIWLKFRGGKGVATALGSVIILAPWATLIAFGCFLLTISMKRIISLGSIVAAISFAVAQLILYQQDLWTAQNISLGLFSVIVPLLIVFQHRSNIGRLLRGEEKELSFDREKSTNAKSV